MRFTPEQAEQLAELIELNKKVVKEMKAGIISANDAAEKILAIQEKIKIIKGRKL